MDPKNLPRAVLLALGLGGVVEGCCIIGPCLSINRLTEDSPEPDEPPVGPCLSAVEPPGEPPPEPPVGPCLEMMPADPPAPPPLDDEPPLGPCLSVRPDPDAPPPARDEPAQIEEAPEDPGLDVCLSPLLPEEDEVPSRRGARLRAVEQARLPADVLAALREDLVPGREA